MAVSPVYFYDDAAFRAQFPAFASTTQFPPTVIQMYWDMAGSIVTNTTYGFLAQKAGPLPLYLLAAHLAQLSTTVANGETPGVLTGATIDKVSVSLEPPPTKSLFDYWLATTPYGLQLLAILSAASVGGFYVPASLGRQGFNFSGANAAVGNPVGFWQR